jgi:transcriptional regulator GlxA family with amidase domain
MSRRPIPSATGGSPRGASVLRRIVHLVVAVALGSVTLVAVLFGGVAKASVDNNAPAAAGALPSSRPSSDGRIVVAVVLGRSGTDAADALAPFEVFASSGQFSVYTVAATHAPARLNGGLHVVPSYDFAEVSGGVARKPDLVVVPAVNDPNGEQESDLRAWIVEQSRTGARILGVCAGSRVLAATGLLNGHRATSHWSRIAPLQESNPDVTWVQGQRYVEDGKITTSAGVSSGIPASLHLVEELAGTAEAAKVAKRVRYPGWAPGGPTAIPIQHFSLGDAGVGLSAVLPWFQPTLAVGLFDGVGEIDTSALFDVYSYASAAHLTPVATGSSVTTAHGVILLTTPAAAFSRRARRLVVPGAHSGSEIAPALRLLAARQELPITPLGQGNLAGFDAALADLASTSGTAISRSTAKMVDYPTHPAADGSTFPAVRVPVLFALAILLAGSVGMIPTVIRVLRRKAPQLSPRAPRTSGTEISVSVAPARSTSQLAFTGDGTVMMAATTTRPDSQLDHAERQQPAATSRIGTAAERDQADPLRVAARGLL